MKIFKWVSLPMGNFQNSNHFATKWQGMNISVVVKKMSSEHYMKGFLRSDAVLDTHNSKKLQEPIVGNIDTKLKTRRKK